MKLLWLLLPPLIRTALVGVVVILVWETLSPVIGHLGGFEPSRPALGSDILYLAIGFWVGRQGPWWTSLAVGALVGAADGLLGWPLSTLFAQPHRVEQYANSTISFRLALGALLALTGMLLGGVGGAFGSWRRRAVEARQQAVDIGEGTAASG